MIFTAALFLGLSTPAAASASGFMVCGGPATFDSSGGTITCTFPAAGEYRLLLLNGTNEIASTSGSVSIDSTEQFGAAIFALGQPASTVLVTLTAGDHDLIVDGLDTGSEIQVVVFDESHACWMHAPIEVTSGTSPVSASFSNPDASGMPLLFIYNGEGGTRSGSASVEFNGDELLSSFSTDVSAVVPFGASFLESNTLEASVSDSGSLRIHAIVIDEDGPTITINPVGGIGGTTTNGRLSVSGHVDDVQATITVNGISVANTEGDWTATVTLSGGLNTIHVVATDPCGNQGSETTTVTFDAPAQGDVDYVDSGSGYFRCGMFNADDTEGSFSCSVPATGTYRLVAINGNDGSTASTTAAVTVDSTEVIGTAQLQLSVPLAYVNLTLTAGTHTIAATGVASGELVGLILFDESKACWLRAPVNVTSEVSPVSASFSIGNPEAHPMLMLANGQPNDTPATAGNLEINSEMIFSGSLPSFSFYADDSRPFSSSNTLAASATAPGSFTVQIADWDSTAPELEVLQIGNGNGWTNQPWVLVSGTIADATATVTVNGEAATLSGTDWSAIVDLDEGANALTVVATDGCGNARQGELSLGYDTSLPTVEITAPDTTVISGSVSVDLSSTSSSPGIYPASTRVFLDGTNVTSLLTVTAADVTGSLTLSTGAHVLRFVAQTLAGVEAETSRTISALPAAPAITMSRIGDVSGTTTQGRVLVTGTVSDAEATLTVNGISVANDGGTWRAYVTLSGGTNTVVATATNAGGSDEASQEVTFDAPAQPDVVYDLQASGFFRCGPANVDEDHPSISCTVPTTGSYRLLITNGANGSTPTTGSTAEVDATEVIGTSALSVATNQATAVVSLTAGTHTIGVTDIDVASQLQIIVLDETKACLLGDALDVTAALSPVSQTFDITNPEVQAGLILFNGLPNGVLANNADIDANDDHFSGSIASDTTIISVEGASFSVGSNTLSCSVTGSGSYRAEVLDLDQTAPELEVLQIGSGNGTSNQATVIVSGNISDATATVAINGVEATNTGTAWSGEVTLAPGENSLSVIATDLCGNESSGTFAITYVTEGPEVSVVSPESTQSAGGIDIHVEYSDVAWGIDTSTVAVVLNGTDITSQLDVDSSGAEGTVNLAAGDYTLRVFVANEAGVLTDETYYFTLEAVDASPTLEIITPTIDTTMSPAAISIAYSEEETGVDLSTLHVLLDGTEITEDLTRDESSAGQTRTISVGEHTLAVSVKDRQQVEATDSVTFTIHTPQPVVEILTPEHLSVVPDSPVLVAIQFSDLGATVAPSGITLTVDSNDPVAAEFVEGDIAWWYLDVNDDIHTLLAKATDDASAWGTDSVTIYTRAAQPNADLSPADGSLVYTESLVLSASAGDSLAGPEPESWTLRLDDVPLEDLDISGVIAGKTITDVPEGTHVFEVYVVDVFGRAATGSSRFLIDRTAPLIELSDIHNGQSVTESTRTIHLNYGDALSGVDESSVQFQVDGVPLEDNGWTMTTSPFGAELTGTFSDGEHELAAWVTDRAGNIGGTGPLSLIVSSDAPTIVGDCRPGLCGAGFTVAGRVRLNFEWTSLLNTTVDVTVDGTSIMSVYPSHLRTASVELSLTDGEHDVEATVTDEVGRSVSWTTTLSVDHEAPIVALSTANGAVETAVPTAFAATWESEITIDSDEVAVSVDADAFTGALDTTATGTSGELTMLTDGSHRLVVSVPTTTGLVGGATSRFLVDADESLEGSEPDIGVWPPTDSFIKWGTFSASASLTDAAGIDTSTVQMSVDDLPFTGKLVVFSNETRGRIEGLGEGEHTVTFNARNLEGRLAEKSSSFTVDLTDPTVDFSGLTWGEIVTAPTQTLELTYSDLLSGIDETRTQFWIDHQPIVDGAEGWTVDISSTGASAHGPLPAGHHAVGGVAYDHAGRSTSRQVEVVVSTGAPTLHVDCVPGVCSGTAVTRGPVRLNLGWSTDLVDMSEVTLLVNGTTRMDLNPPNALAHGASIVLDLAEGTYPLSASARDAAGRTATWTGTVVVNSAAPTVTLTPANAAVVTGTTIHVAGAYEAAAGIDAESAALFVDGEAYEGTLAADEDGATADLTTLSDGIHELELRIADTNGLVGGAVSRILVDQADVVPDHSVAVTIVTPETGASLSLSTLAVTATFADAVPPDPSTFTAQLDDVDVSKDFLTNTRGTTGTLSELTEGWHDLTIGVADNEGGTATATSHVMIDRTTPDAVIADLIDGQILTSGDQTISVTLNDALSGIDVSTFQLWIDGTPVRVEGSGWAVDVTTSEATLVGHLNDGHHDIWTQVSDRAGNTNGSSVSVNVSTAGPSLEVNCAPGRCGTGLTSSGPLRLNLEWAAPYFPASDFSVTVDGLLRAHRQLQPADGSAASVVLPLTDGSHTVVAVVTDTLGQLAEWERTIVVDHTAPTPWLAPAMGTLLTDNPLDVVATYSIPDGDSVGAVTFTVDGVDWAGNVTAGGGTASIELEDLESAWHRVEVSVTYDSGLTTGATTIFKTELEASDPDGPVINLFSTDSALFSVDSPIVPATVHITLDDEPVTTALVTTRWHLIYELPPLADGEHTIVISATNEDGGLSEASRTFDIDTVLPELSMEIAGLDGQFLTSSSATISLHYSDEGMGINSVTLFIDDERVGDASLDWEMSETEPGESTATGTLTDGWHRISAMVTDVVGNSASTSRFILVTTDGPAIVGNCRPGTCDDSFSTTGPVRINLAWTDDELVGVASVELTDGEDTVFTYVPPSGSRSLSRVITLSNGTHELTATVTDNVGRESDWTATVVVDSNAPIVWLTPLEGTVTDSDPLSVVAHIEEPVGAETSSVAFLIDGVAFEGMIDSTSTTSTISVTDLSNGAHSIVVVVGNDLDATAAAETRVLVGSEPAGAVPTIELSPPDGAASNRNPLLVFGTFAGLSAIDTGSFQLSVDGTSVAASMDVDEAGFQILLPILPWGAHTILASVQDQQGRHGSASSEVTLDGYTPTVSFDELSDGDLLTSSAVSAAFTYSDAESGLDNTKTTFFIDGVRWAAVDGWTLTLDPSGTEATAAGPLTDGPHILTAGAYDRAGNLGLRSISVRVSSSSTAPTLTANCAPGVCESGFVSKGPLRLNLHWSSPFTSIASVFVTDGLDTVLSLEPPGPGVDRTTVQLDLEDGEHVLTAVVTDEADRTATWDATIVVDHTAPSLSLTPEDGLATTDDSLTVLAAYASAEGIDTSAVALSVNSTTAAWDATPTTTTATATLAEPGAGTYRLRAVVADLDGLTVGAESRVVINTSAPEDSTGPTVTLTPDDGASTSDSPVSIMALFEDVSGIDPATVRVAVDGDPFPGSLVADTNHLSLEADLAEGEHTITVSVRDLVGNKTTVESEITVDRTAPTVSFDGLADYDEITTAGAVDVELDYSDDAAGINPDSIRLVVDGADIGRSPSTPGGLVVGSSSPASASLRLSAGQHTLVAHVTDFAGNTSSSTIHVTLTITRPTLTVTCSSSGGCPADGSYSTLAALPMSLEWTDPAGDEPDVEVTLDGDSVLSVNPPATGITTASLNPSLSEGAHLLVATVTDENGEMAVWRRSFNVDRSNPTLALTPANGTILHTEDGYVLVRADYTDVSVAQSFTMTLQVNNGTASNAHVTLNRSYPFHLVDAVYSLAADVTDAGGHTAHATSQFILDRAPPVVTQRMPPLVAGSATYVATSSAVALGVNCRDAITGVASAVLVIDGDTAHPVTLTYDANAGTCLAPLRSLSDGLHPLSFAVTDGGGLTTTVTTGIVVDTQAPVITLVPPSNTVARRAPNGDIQYREGVSLPRSLGWTVSETVSMTATLDGVALCQNGPGESAPECLTPNSYSYAATIANRTWPSGRHLVHFEATDAGGHTSALDTYVVVDATPPTAHLSLPGLNHLPDEVTWATNATTDIQVVLTASDTSTGVVSTSLQVGTTPFTIIPLTLGSTPGTWTASLALSAGTHQLKAVVIDGAGNVTVALEALVVDTTAPTVTFVSPAPSGGFTKDSLWAVSFTCVDGATGVALDTVTLSDGSTTSSCPIGPGGTANCILANLAPGTHTFVARAVDRVGNEGTATTTLKVDRQAPTGLIEADDGRGFRTGTLANTTNNLRALFSDNLAGINPASVRFKVDAGYWQEPSSILDNVATLVGVTLPEGNVVITVEAADRAGNKVTLTQPFFVDLSAPMIILNLPPLAYGSSWGPEGVWGADDLAVEIEILTTNFASLVIMLDDTLVALYNHVEAGKRSEQLYVPIDGLHTVTVYAIDNDERTDSVSASFIRDTTKPRIAFVSPHNGSVLTTPNVDVTLFISHTATMLPGSVTVNGVPAVASGAYYVAHGVAVMLAPDLKATLVAKALYDDGEAEATEELTLDIDPPAAPPAVCIPNIPGPF